MVKIDVTCLIPSFILTHGHKIQFSPICTIHLLHPQRLKILQKVLFYNIVFEFSCRKSTSTGVIFA